MSESTAATSSTPAPNETGAGARIPLVLDTDTAADDCFALLVAALHPRADLRAVTVVAGNVGFERQLDNALLTLGLAGRLDVPVHAGASTPLRRERVGAEEVQGDGTGGLRRGERQTQAAAEPAWETLVRLARELAGHLTIVAIGPLTNVALAVQHDPGFAARVRRLVIMGGSANGRGNVTPVAEYNIFVDPEAAAEVFAAGFPQVTLVPWDPVCIRDSICDAARMQRIEAIGTPLAHFFVRADQAPFDFDSSHGLDGSTHCDTLSTLLALQPDLATASRRCRVQVETDSDLTRGVTVCEDRSNDPVAPGDVDVVLAADRERLFAEFEALLALHPAGQVLPVEG